MYNGLMDKLRRLEALSEDSKADKRVLRQELKKLVDLARTQRKVILVARSFISTPSKATVNNYNKVMMEFNDGMKVYLSDTTD